MGSQQGVAESGRHLPWATAIFNHDQSSDPSAGSLVVSSLEALLFWARSSPLAKPCRHLHRRRVGVVGTVHGGDRDSSGHPAQACDRGVCRTHWSVKRDIHPLLSCRQATVCHMWWWATFCCLTVYSGCVLHISPHIFFFLKFWSTFCMQSPLLFSLVNPATDLVLLYSVLKKANDWSLIVRLAMKGLLSHLAKRITL